MRRVVVAPDFTSFRDAARRLIALGVEPSAVTWEEQSEQLAIPGLFTDVEAEPPPTSPLLVPRAVVELAQQVICHRDPKRLPVLYRVLWRIHHGERALLRDPLDDDVRALFAYEKEIDRDVHRIHAFVRFRRIEVEGDERFVAWFRPEHRSLELALPFFVDRFSAIRWAILTPDASASWDGAALALGPGARRDAAPSEDELESLFQAYYRATFNPTRVSERALKTKIPPALWTALPEIAGFEQQIAEAGPRVHEMIDGRISDAAVFVPKSRELSVLREAATRCTACPLHGPATQTVFGEGPGRARMVLVGEQPGDREDLAGRPFVGPAGQVLDGALAEAGIARDQVYLTNAVKHFKFELRPLGKPPRLHQRPNAKEVRACSAWLHAELEALAPEVVVCLGVTAGKALLGPGFRLNRGRGQVFSVPRAKQIIATVHPAAILRMFDDEARSAARRALVEDLRRASALLSKSDP